LQIVGDWTNITSRSLDVMRKVKLQGNYKSQVVIKREMLF
jgi:hypothetical protein